MIVQRLDGDVPDVVVLVRTRVARELDRRPGEELAVVLPERHEIFGAIIAHPDLLRIERGAREDLRLDVRAFRDRDLDRRVFFVQKADEQEAGLGERFGEFDRIGLREIDRYLLQNFAAAQGDRERILAFLDRLAAVGHGEREGGLFAALVDRHGVFGRELELRLGERQDRRQHRRHENEGFFHHFVLSGFSSPRCS